MEKKPETSLTGNSMLLQRNSPAIRIWHWLTFLVVTTLVVTVLLASTALNPRKNMQEIQLTLKAKNVTVDNSQAFSVAHLFDDKMWDLHKYLGFALTLLFLSRIVIEFTQTPEERNQVRLKKALYSFLQSTKVDEKKELKHYLLIKYSYLIFYLLLLAMVVTGLIIAFGADLGLSGQGRHTVKEIHGFVQYFIYAFMFFHLVGVIRADLSNAKGIVSGMINGGK